MNKSDQRIRKFNPGTFLSEEEVIEQFVVRKRELGIVLEVLCGNIDSPSCQHVLVVAPRGRGKTMLLARIAAELNTDEELSGCLLPVRFMEESHEVLNIADFWLETLFHLARESAKHDPVLAQELRETHADLIDRWRERELADRVLATVLDAADRLGKKLVLMVENLQSIYENVDDDFGWQLRGTLQTEPQIMLLATATSRFKGLDDAEQPFFEQFRILDLEPLNTEECRRLWQVVTGDEVSEDGIRPLEILTGGSPRLLVIVAEFAQHRSLSQLMEELVTLIDDHTEYFRSHLEVLASVERRVYLAVIDLWQPSNAGEIATRARKDIRTVSTLLRRLVNRGAVIVEGTGRKRMYVASERLYSIYYKLRRERDEAAVVANLIYFMAVFYSKAELAEMSDRLIAEAAESKVIREGFERAIAEQPQVGRVFSIVRPSIDQTSDLATPIENESVERLFEEITTALKEEAYEKVIEIVDQAFTTRSTNRSRVSEPLILRGLLSKALAHERLSEFTSANATYDEVIARFGDSDAPDLQVGVACAFSQKGNAQVELGEFVLALACYDEVIIRLGDSDAPNLQVVVAWALCKKGDVQVQQGELAAGVTTYDEVIARFGDSDTFALQERVAWTLYAKGDVQVQLGEFTSAVACYDEVIARFGDSDAPALQVPAAGALSGKGNMQVQLGELEVAVACYDEVVARFGDSDAVDLQERVAWVLCKKGDVQSRLGEFVAALACYDEVITRFGDSEALMLQERVAWAWSGKGDVQSRLGEFVAALSAYDEAVARLGDSDAPDHQAPVAWTLFRKGIRQINMGRAKEALHTCEEIERRLGALTGNEKIEFTWRVRSMRVMVLMVQKKRRAAVDAFRSAYAVFVPDNETIMNEMLHFVPELIAQGFSERDLVEILSSDREKSDALVPLIVALLQRAGEVVRAPVEILEVAKDINKDIERRMAG